MKFLWFGKVNRFIFVCRRFCSAAPWQSWPASFPCLDLPLCPASLKDEVTWEERAQGGCVGGSCRPDPRGCEVPHGLFFCRAAAPALCPWHMLHFTPRRGLPWVPLVSVALLSVRREQKRSHNSAGLALGVIEVAGDGCRAGSIRAPAGAGVGGAAHLSRAPGAALGLLAPLPYVSVLWGGMSHYC